MRFKYIYIHCGIQTCVSGKPHKALQRPQQQQQQ